jgi:LacI family transcriptional regulator
MVTLSFQERWPMATLKEIAEEAGVSVNTVSRILAGERKARWPGMVKRVKEVQEIAERMNYRPNAAARAMRTSKTHQIGVLLRNAPDRPLHFPAAFEYIQGMDQQLTEVNYVLSLVRISNIDSGLSDQSRTFSERMLEGMIVLGPMPSIVLDQVENQMAHVIYVDADIWRPVGCIRRDEKWGATQAAQALVQAGYPSITWLGPAITSSHYSVGERYAAARDVAAAAGMELRHIETRASALHGLPELHQILTSNVGFIAYDVYYAQSVAMAANQIGLIAGRDFGLTCCDDSDHLRDWWPELSRVGTDRFTVGKIAADMLLARLKVDEPTSSRLVRGTWVAGNTAPGPGKLAIPS